MGYKFSSKLFYYIPQVLIDCFIKFTFKYFLIFSSVTHKLFW